MKLVVDTNRIITDWFLLNYRKKIPFFIFINYMELHSPYDPPKKYKEIFLKKKKLTLNFVRLGRIVLPQN